MSRVDKYRLDRGRVGWLLAGLSRRAWIKDLFHSEESLLKPQDSVHVSELNEDRRGLFVKFVGNTNFGRTPKFLNDKIKIEKDLNKTEA